MVLAKGSSVDLAEAIRVKPWASKSLRGSTKTCIECTELINNSKTFNKTADNRNRIPKVNKRELKVIYMRTQRQVYTTTWSKDCLIKRKMQLKMLRKLILRDKVSRILGSQWRETRCKYLKGGITSSASTTA